MPYHNYREKKSKEHKCDGITWTQDILGETIYELRKGKQVLPSPSGETFWVLTKGAAGEKRDRRVNKKVCQRNDTDSQL
jgi:hypothetical protein